MGEWAGKFIGLVKTVIVRVGTRMGVAGVVAAITAAILSGSIGELWEKVKKDVYAAICETVREKTQLELDPNDPITDPSMSAALTERSGITITSVVDAEVFKHDLSVHASGIIKGHTGMELTNIFSVEQIKTDVVGHAAKVVYDRTGLDIQGAVSYDDVQKKIYKAVENRLAELVVQRLKAAAEEFSNPEATLDDLLSMVYRAQEAKNLKVRDVALGTAASIVVAAYATISTPMKRRVDAYRKRAQNREAQRRFRQRHGLRMRYDRLRPVRPAPTGG